MKDKITIQDIENNILDIEIVKYITKGGKILRWAVITTASGFAVTGRPSATINQLNDNVEVGEKVAIDNAKSEMWALMGYNLSVELNNYFTHGRTENIYTEEVTDFVDENGIFTHKKIGNDFIETEHGKAVREQKEYLENAVVVFKEYGIEPDKKIYRLDIEEKINLARNAINKMDMSRFYFIGE